VEFSIRLIENVEQGKWLLYTQFCSSERADSKIKVLNIFPVTNQ